MCGQFKRFKNAKKKWKMMLKANKSNGAEDGGGLSPIMGF